MMVKLWYSHQMKYLLLMETDMRKWLHKIGIHHYKMVAYSIYPLGWLSRCVICEKEKYEVACF